MTLTVVAKLQVSSSLKSNPAVGHDSEPVQCISVRCMPLAAVVMERVPKVVLLEEIDNTTKSVFET